MVNSMGQWSSKPSKDCESSPCQVRSLGSTNGLAQPPPNSELQNGAIDTQRPHEALPTPEFCEGRLTRAAERFWTHVEKTLTCWLWTGARTRGGYGSCGDPWHPGKTMVAHRRAYQHAVGPIPPGMQLDHICRVRNCVRPAHLEPVTSRENTLRGDNHVARQALQTHCKRGHPLSGDNLRLTKRGRACRACDKAFKRVRRPPAQNSEATALRLWAACAGGVLGAVEAEGEGAAAATTHNAATQVRGKGAVREANGAAAEGKRGVWAAHERVLTYEGAGPLIFPIALLGPNGARAVPANASKGEALKAGEGGHLRVGEAGAASAGECGGAVPNAHAAQVGDGVDVNAAPHQHNSHSQQSTHGAQSPPSPRALETAQLCMGLGVPGAGVGA